MKKILFALGFSLLWADNYNYTDFQKEYVQGFNQYEQNLNKEFQDYKDTLNREFENYKKELSKYWQNPELTTKKTFVEYSKDKKVRKKVDFEKNYIQIDVIGKNEKEAKQKIATSLAKLSIETTNRAFNNNPVLKKVEKKFEKVGVSAKPKNKPIIADLIYKKPPTKKDVINFAVKSVKKAKIEVKKSKLPDMKVYSVKIPLPPKSYLIKARDYKSDVLKRSNQFKLVPEFIYAIIHTESSFNPMARSYVPAFGLMQIVPQTAGRDAYKMLYGKPKLLTPGYLYNSSNNILIGSAYLKKIYYGYFKGVKDPLSRLYLTIPAYNTGAGNVACAFNSSRKDFRGRTICSRSRGDYSIRKALPKINSMTPSQVYNQLMSNLRYEEPKKYLKRVRKRIFIYKNAMAKGEI